MKPTVDQTSKKNTSEKTSVPLSNHEKTPHKTPTRVPLWMFFPTVFPTTSLGSMVELRCREPQRRRCNKVKGSGAGVSAVAQPCNCKSGKLEESAGMEGQIWKVPVNSIYINKFMTYNICIYKKSNQKLTEISNILLIFKYLYAYRFQLPFEPDEYPTYDKHKSINKHCKIYIYVYCDYIFYFMLSLDKGS